MCDTVAGELILCFPRVDTAAHNLVALLQEGKIEHVEYVESLDGKLAKLELKPAQDLDFEFHRVRVPAGQESWKTAYLHFFYKHEFLKVIPKLPAALLRQLHGRSDYQFTVSLNYLLRLAGPASPQVLVSAKDFHFGAHHVQYKQRIGLVRTSSPGLDKIRVLVLDSGIASDAPVIIADRRNLVDPQNRQTADDDHGHGTAVALLIHDLAPDAEFIIYKVADATGRISEWDALAGMVAKSDANVINLSLQFGLLDKSGGCPLCGRESRASRSAVFENVLSQFVKRSPRPIVVAAAGNYGSQELAYPARFGDVLAIGSITSRDVLSSGCNRGSKNQAEDLHRNHFVLPGGESGPARLEPVLTSGRGKNWSGTSFAAGFASGLIAGILGSMGMRNFDFDVFVDGLRQSADKNLPNYSMAEHGNGLMHV